jgi:hypothetical protein
MNFTDWIGAIGVFLILMAFFLNLIEKLDSKGLAYLLLNFIGAGLACLASILIHYWPFIILEAAWSGVSAYGLYKFFKNN